MKLHRPACPGGRAIFCDDIRIEQGGKATLVGVYSGEMLFSADTKFPVMIPKLGIATFWSEPEKNYVRDLVFEATLVSVDAKIEEEGRLIARSQYTLPNETIEKTSAEAARTGVPMSNGLTSYMLASFQISGPSKVRVRAVRNGEEWMLGAIRIAIEGDK